MRPGHAIDLYFPRRLWAAAVVLGGLLTLATGYVARRGRWLFGLVAVIRWRSSAEAGRSATDPPAAQQRTLREDDARFRVALDAMTHGLCMFGADGRLLVVNRKLADMLGVAEPPPAGATLAACLTTLAGSTVLRAHDRRRAAVGIARLLAAGRPATMVWELPDGIALAVGFQPGAAGWLLTCEDMTAQRRASRRIAFLAHHDPLTGLANRTRFLERLEQAVAAATSDAGCAVLCLDLDRFKEINDTQGHSVGDAVLREVGERLRRCLRGGELAARLGGDEFAVIQPGLRRIGDVMTLAQRLIDEVSLPCHLLGRELSIGLSIGIAVAPEDGSEPAALLRHADMALYSAKAECRGGFRFFDHAMNARLELRREMAAELAAALPAGQFALFYQPFVDTASRRPVGFEALLRWRHPVRGLVPPDQFIPLAEETGEIVAIGAWVLHQACMEAAAWPAAARIAVNLSPAQFRRHGLVEAVADALDRSGLAPELLELELTETVLLADTPETAAILGRLRGLGVSLVMDDFGTGYSSLAYLHRFRFDKVKIDRSFITALGYRREGLAIVRAIIGICRHLDMTTLAEGVETEEQLGVLRGECCMEVQGFLLGRPGPPEAARAMLAGSARDAAALRRLGAGM